MSRPDPLLELYHAHVYFDADTLDQARALHALAGELGDVAIGRVLTRPVGPHPHWSWQLIFRGKDFERITVWLESHRQGLTVLIHGVSGDDLRDHTKHVSWLGAPAELNLALFRTADRS